MPTNKNQTEESIPAWVPRQVLEAIHKDACGNDPVRSDLYASVDAMRMRRAIARADSLLRAHRCYGDEEFMDVRLARAALLVVGALVRLTEESDG